MAVVLSKDDNAERQCYLVLHHFIPSYGHSFEYIFPIRKLTASRIHELNSMAFAISRWIHFEETKCSGDVVVKPTFLQK